MKVTGFTIARNVRKFDYPIKESILSILPICDQFLILVGDSEDDTLAYLQNIESPKIIIKHSTWNETLQDGGKVLAVETDKALQLIDADTDWCFYIQADEIVHEKYLADIRQQMEEHLTDRSIDGFLFNYEHFFNSFDYVGKSSRFYKYEIRIIRNNKNIYAYRDAQGFRMNENQKLKVKLLDAYIYHYGWVRPPKYMKEKQKSIMKYYHDQEFIDQVIGDSDEFDYTQFNVFLEKFNATHPELMKDRASAMDWDFNIKHYRKTHLVKDRVKNFLKKYLSIDVGYANYTLIK